MTAVDLAKEEFTVLPPRLETSRLGMRPFPSSYSNNWAGVWQGNYSHQQMNMCVMNCVQNVTQYNITIIIQINR